MTVRRTLVLLLLCLIIFSATAVSATWYYADIDVMDILNYISPSMFQWVEIPDQEIDIVNHFLNLLNNKESCNVTIEGVTYTEPYDALIAAFNGSPSAYVSGKSITLHNNSYIGTMQTWGDDVKAVRDLFGDVLLDEESAATEYSLMLKREPIDGREYTGEAYYMDGDHGWTEENAFYPGAEMILFSTNWAPAETSGYVIVYATVFTRYPLTDENGNYLYERDANGNIRYYTYETVNRWGQTVTNTTTYPIYQYGDWVKISGDEAFVGDAQVVNYSTGDATRSFATGTWRSSREYGGSLSRVSLSAMVNSVVK